MSDINGILKTVKERKIRHIQLWFTDILGRLKSMEISDSELKGALEEGIGFDGSSIEGFARIEESDVMAMPDPETFRILPWTPLEGPVARLICDVQDPYGNPYPGDPRFVLKKILKKASDLGYVFHVGPEMEFFYFKTDRSPECLDLSGYFDLTPPDLGTDLRRETAQALEAMGMKTECTHHEVAPSQHEIDLRYAEALRMADGTMTYRQCVKEVAALNGVYATFMPKPLFGENGSGMHVHQSLFKGKRNAFFDADDEYNLSKIGKSYVAGLLAHVKEIALITNQWVNSYKRLVPGYEAPVYICWARRNRSAMVRVPLYKPGKEAATRVELRNPDPSANPYLAFAAMLAAGLDGIEKGMELPAEASNNIYDMTAAEREKAGIDALPEDLYQAIKSFEGSSFVREALGDHVCDYLVRNKWAEWDEYKKLVTPYELDRYLSIL